MVWFQCEDCGENLKKPKLTNHFRICSATKLSCIDCGEMFGQESVQGHTQCITEAEKYGPKGQGKASNGATPSKNAKQQPDIDINVGLSERPPWFCSLCNTKATSKQTLLLHADGKKHRAKAWAFHAANQQQSKQTDESAKEKTSTIENVTNGEVHDNKHVKEPKVQDTPKAEGAHTNTETETGEMLLKKRKLDDSQNNSTGADKMNGMGNGVLQVEIAKAEKMECPLKKAKNNGHKVDEVMEPGSMKEEAKKKIKLKKLIKSALKTNPDGVLKMKKLKKLVVKSIWESGIPEGETQLSDMLEQKINSSSRFRVDDKYVWLVNKD